MFAWQSRIDWNAAAAIVGTLAWVLAALLWAVDRRQRKIVANPQVGVQVSLRTGVLTSQNGRFSEDKFIIGATNKTSHPVRITSVGLRVDGLEETLVLMQPDSAPRIPCVLAETETVTAWLDLNDVRTALARSVRPAGPYRLTAFAGDGFAREYVGESLTLER